MRRLAAGAALAVAVAACGVRSQPGPVGLDPSVTPSGTPAPRPVVVEVWFVGDGGRVVPVRRPVAAPGTPAQRLAALVSGPDPLSRLTSAVDEALVEVRAGVAEVVVPAGFARRPRAERLLATAQVVLTLTASREVAVVRFTSDGRPVAVPRAGGGETRGPLTRADVLGAAAARP